jgi:glycosyltransferase involved in cell wall biosynthesis
VRDHAAYLAAALESALGQTRRPHEVVVVDDGSTDGSAAVAEAFGDPVRVLRQAPAGGPAARNAGVAASTGEVLGFLDADDLWPADRLERLLERLAAPDAPGLVFGRLEEFVTEEADPAALPAPRPATPATLATTLLLARATHDRVGPFPVDLPIADFAPWLQRARTLGIAEAMVDAVVLRRRVHPGNAVAWREQRQALTAAIRASLAQRRGDAG